MSSKGKLLQGNSSSAHLTYLSGLCKRSRYGFQPALEYAAAAGSARTVGLGGRLGDAYFGPLFRDGNFDPNWTGKHAAASSGGAESGSISLDPL